MSLRQGRAAGGHKSEQAPALSSGRAQKRASAGAASHERKTYCWPHSLQRANAKDSGSGGRKVSTDTWQRHRYGCQEGARAYEVKEAGQPCPAPRLDCNHSTLSLLRISAMDESGACACRFSVASVIAASARSATCGANTHAISPPCPTRRLTRTCDNFIAPGVDVLLIACICCAGELVGALRGAFRQESSLCGLDGRKELLILHLRFIALGAHGGAYRVQFPAKGAGGSPT